MEGDPTTLIIYINCHTCREIGSSVWVYAVHLSYHDSILVVLFSIILSLLVVSYTGFTACVVTSQI